MCLFLNKVEIPKKIGKMLGSSQKKIVSLQPKMNQPISAKPTTPSDVGVQGSYDSTL